jgi:hypothetical protein
VPHLAQPPAALRDVREVRLHPPLIRLFPLAGDAIDETALLPGVVLRILVAHVLSPSGPAAVRLLPPIRQAGGPLPAREPDHGTCGIHRRLKGAMDYLGREVGDHRIVAHQATNPL